MIVRMAPRTKAFSLASLDDARHEACMRGADNWPNNIRALDPRLREDDG